jgi:hypothetical protein
LITCYGCLIETFNEHNKKIMEESKWKLFWPLQRLE